MTKKNEKTCARCGVTAKGTNQIADKFGYRNNGGYFMPQSYCFDCRGDHHKIMREAKSKDSTKTSKQVRPKWSAATVKLKYKKTFPYGKLTDVASMRKKLGV